MVQFRGYDFYELSDGGVEFKFGEDEALKFGASQEDAFDLMLSKFCGMVRRDLLIEKWLIHFGIENVVDIGGDRGGLAKRLSSAGLNVTVLDPNPEAIKYLRENSISCHEASVGDFILDPTNFGFQMNEKTAVICLNFTHVPWENENEKSDFFCTVNDLPVGAFVFSWIGGIPLAFSSFEECRQFNPFAQQYRHFQSLIRLMERVRMLKFFPYLSQLKGADEYVRMQRFLTKK